MKPNDSEWHELIHLARQGDLEARGRLLERYRDHLQRLADQNLRGRVTVRTDTSDVVQLTFLEGHRNLDQFLGQDEVAFRAWLERILENAIHRTFRDHLGLQKRSMLREQSLDESASGNPAPRTELDAGSSTPSQRAMQNERENILEEALARLPPEQREAVHLRHRLGWSLADIAHHLGKTPVATAGLVKRGMDSLRKYLNQSEP